MHHKTLSNTFLILLFLFQETIAFLCLSLISGWKILFVVSAATMYIKFAYCSIISMIHIIRVIIKLGEQKREWSKLLRNRTVKLSTSESIASEWRRRERAPLRNDTWDRLRSFAYSATVGTHISHLSSNVTHSEDLYPSSTHASSCTGSHKTGSLTKLYHWNFKKTIFAIFERLLQLKVLVFF